MLTPGSFRSGYMEHVLCLSGYGMWERRAKIKEHYLTSVAWYANWDQHAVTGKKERTPNVLVLSIAEFYSYDTSVRIWDVVKGRTERILKGYSIG